MTEEFSASKPIYMQIADRIIRKIVRRENWPGDKLPSVREMAVESGVNPNTIQRTYSELERMGIVETRRGQGTFITENKEILSSISGDLQREVIELFVNQMKELGLTEDEMIFSIQQYFKAEREA